MTEKRLKELTAGLSQRSPHSAGLQPHEPPNRRPYERPQTEFYAAEPCLPLANSETIYGGTHLDATTEGFGGTHVGSFADYFSGTHFGNTSGEFGGSHMGNTSGEHGGTHIAIGGVSIEF